MSHMIHAVWICPLCRRNNQRKKVREEAIAAGEPPRYKPRVPGAQEGHSGPATPETRAKLKALFERDPEKVIHRLCRLLEGFCANEKLKAIATGQGKGGGLQTDCA